MSTIRESRHLDVLAESAEVENAQEPEQRKAYRVVRYKSASLAISRDPIFYGPLVGTNKSVLVEFKAKAQRQGGRNRIDYKAGITGSGSRFLQGVQGVVSTVIPGNPSALRSPVRSRLYAAATPGGPPGLSGISPASRDRGYRCPEGYQYGGRFTDSRFSTCGQKLFEIAGRIGASIAQIAEATQRAVAGQTVSGRNVNFGDAPGEVITSRAAQIPRVSNFDSKRYNDSSEKIVSEMVSFAGPATRMVRRDGFSLTPVVSAAVLRTVPDNRDMESANYIVYADKPSSIGTSDEIGLLSNTGVRKLTYVLPGGSTISLEKARTLTVGERRKLGRTIRTLESIKTDSDPAAKLKGLASEMGSGIAYTESFKVENANDLVDAVIPGTSNVKQVRRWYYEAFLRSGKGKMPDRAEASSQSTNAKIIGKKIENLQNAIKHLNSNGNVSDISPAIVAEAIKRSRMYKKRMLKNGLVAFDRADGQTFIEIPASQNFEHIGAAVAADIQSYLGLPTPDVVFTGSGTRRPYLLQESVDVLKRAKVNRELSSDKNNSEDMLRIAVSDFISDTRDRDISTITALETGGTDRAISSINRNSALSGLGRTAAQLRRQLQANSFYSSEYLNMMKSNFAKRSEAQRRLAIKLFDAMIVRLREYDISEMSSRLSLDGEFTQSEKSHIKLIESLIESRIEMLTKTRKTFLDIIGLES
jgi:hypothetical protein